MAKAGAGAMACAGNRCGMVSPRRGSGSGGDGTAGGGAASCPSAGSGQLGAVVSDPVGEVARACAGLRRAVTLGLRRDMGLLAYSGSLGSGT